MGLTWFAAFKDGFMGWKANLVECPPPPSFRPRWGGGLSEGHIGLSNMRTSPGGGYLLYWGLGGKCRLFWEESNYLNGLSSIAMNVSFNQK